MSTSVLIADDHGVLRAGLRALLNSEPDLEVVGEAADGLQALLMASRLSPDVVLADISMPGRTGIEVARELRQTQPDTQVLILTMHEDSSLLQEAMRAGAAGYVIKRAAEAELIRAIHVIADHGTYVDHAFTAYDDSLPEPAAEAPVEGPRLTSQETDLLGLLASAHTNQQIARVMGVDLDTLEKIRCELMKRLGVNGRVGLIKEARRRGLV